MSQPPYPPHPPEPLPPTGPREMVTGTAFYGWEQHNRCQYCTKPAEIWDLDGSWCSPECQLNDRGSESTWWRRAVAR